MACLGAVAYDPAVAATKSCASAIAMTAIDTTNARITFVAPPNGTVMVRLAASVTGGTTFPAVLLGVLDGATVKVRFTPDGGWINTGATLRSYVGGTAIISGLTPGTSYTWDAAYGVEGAVASSVLAYGGPNDTTTNNSHGALIFEVWETGNLLGSATYDPSTEATKACSSLIAMTALDTTNLRITFTAPPSGRVMWRLAVPFTTTNPVVQLGVLDGATVKARQIPFQGIPAATTNAILLDASGVITGLTPGTSYTYDAAYGVDIVAASSNLRYGGPNNTTAGDARGAARFEIWAA